MAEQISSRAKEHIRLIWYEREDGSKSVAFRGRKHQLLEEPTDYVEEIRTEQLRTAASATGLASAVDAAAYALKEFHLYLSLKRYDLPDVTDEILVAYRKWSFTRICKKRNSRGKRQAKQSVNVKLRNIYKYLSWCQITSRIPIGIVGWRNCAVQTSLPDAADSKLEADNLESHKYPKLYFRIGEHSREGRRQHWATADELFDLERWLSENENERAAQRDILLLRIADVMAWRIGTILDLRLDDFSDAAIKDAEKAKATRFTTVPSTQKFDTELAFSMPWELVYAIRHYIQDNDGRKAILLSANTTEIDTEGRIFLNCKGRPLTRAGTCSRLSRAFKAVGMPLGAGWHAIRRGSTKRFARKEIDFRRKYGLSTAREDIADAISEYLGQTTSAAQKAYVQANDDLQQNSFEEQVQNELTEARAIIAEQRTQIALLQQQFSKCRDADSHARSRNLAHRVARIQRKSGAPRSRLSINSPS